MSESIERFSVAEIERRTGVARRTLQFWSDNGVLVSVAARHSGSGNPHYDAIAECHRRNCHADCYCCDRDTRRITNPDGSSRRGGTQWANC